MSFIEELRKAKAEVQGVPSIDEHNMPWVTLLRKTKAEALARSADPWRLQLERVRGKIHGGVERISTQEIFDHLEVPQRSRDAGGCRRLAKLMRELGWTQMKMRMVAQTGFKDEVRGYVREARHSARGDAGAVNHP
jgi:hypothetical protein